MSGESIKWEIRSIRQKAAALKILDILYILNFPWFCFVAFLEYALWTGGSENTIFSPTEIDLGAFYIIFVAIWLLRYPFRRRYTNFDFFMALFPTFLIIFLLLANDGWANYISELSIFILLFALTIMIVLIIDKYKLSYSYKYYLNDIFSVISPFMNPYIFLGIPFYIIIIVLSVSIIVNSISSGLYTGLFFLIFIPYAVRLIRRLTNQSAKLLLRLDPRRAVLYLRTFDLDEERVNNSKWSVFPKKGVEEILSRITGNIGPFIAISNYKNKVQSIGAAKSSYADHEWQDAIRYYMDKSRFVAMLAGDSDAIDWELQTLALKKRKNDALVLLGRPVLAKVNHMLEGKTLRIDLLQAEVARNFPRQEIIGVYLNDDDRLSVLVGHPNKNYSYIAALQDFLRHRPY